MVERIRTLLETRQLTPTQFADVIGIARPIVSHILSGRNKPSLEVVQRILAAMPDISMPWLLNGSGPMLAATPPVAATPKAALPTEPQEVKAPTEAPVPTPKPVPVAAPVALPTAATTNIRLNSIGSESGFEASVAAARPAPKRFAPVFPNAAHAPAKPTESTASVDGATQAAPLLPPKPANEPALAPEAASPAPVENNTSAPRLPDAAALFAGGEKPIRRIVIFYKDGSFADYQPE